MGSPAISRHWFGNTLVCLLSVMLGWLVVTRSLPAYLARVAPETALRLNANQPDALLRQAELLLTAQQTTSGQGQPASPVPRTAAETAVSSAQTAHISDLILRARGLDPLNAQVPHLLADLAERAGQRAQALKLLDATLQHALHESAAVYKLILFNIEAADYVKATAYVELLLRTNPEAFPVVLPVLFYLANTAAATEALIAMLGRNPHGRTWFFLELPTKVADLRTPQTLLLGLQNTANPPSNQEISQYLHALLHRQLYGLAYYTWLQFTPPEHFDSSNLVFNGGFQRPSTALPFDWVITAGSGVTAQIVSNPNADGHQGLNLEFGSGRVEFGGVSQSLVLAPGTYDFASQYQGSLIGRRGLAWRMTCDTPGAPILDAPVQLGIQPTWKDVAQSFTVPEAGCRGQHLALVHTARSASEQLLSGSVWYRHARITRRADAIAADVPK